MTTPLTNLNLQMFRGPTWSAFYKALQLQGNNIGIAGQASLSSSASAAAAYGIDSLFYIETVIAASGTYTLDMTSFTDVAGNTAIALARLKGFWIALLNSEWDATITAPASGITFGPGGVSNAHLLNLANASDLLKLRPGEQTDWWTPAAAGLAVDSTHKVLTTINLDATNAATVRLLFAGSQS